MLQLQYLNTKLQKKHIEQILSNFNIKYTTMKKEIENKINIMIKTFNQDISVFLNNIEEIADEKKKLRKLQRNQNELESVREQLKDKIHEQTKLRREIELLKIENKRLRSGFNSNRNSKRLFSPISRNNNYNSPNNTSLNKTQRGLKVKKSYFYKTEKKESNRFKSPPNFELRNRKKITELTKDEKNKTIKTKLSKENNYKFHTHKKNTLSSGLSIDLKTEPNIKNFKSQRSIIKKNNKDDAILVKKKNIKKSNTIIKSIFNNKLNTNKKENNTKLLNKTTSNFNKIDKKFISKSINETGDKKIKNIIETKENEHNSSSSSSSSSSSRRSSSISSSVSNESKSISTIGNREEEKIDEEINEMNDMEKEILSLIEDIKDFKNNNSKLT